MPVLHVDEWRGPLYNVAPTQSVPAVLNSAPDRVVWIRWGLIPSWAKNPEIGSRLINARAETIREKPSFKRSYEKRRCVVLADGFYEWRTVPGVKRRQPIYFRLKSGEPFGFAGLWDQWKSEAGEVLTTCTLITTTPNELIKPIHDRMPVMLSPEGMNRWLTAAGPETGQLDQLLLPFPADQMTCHPVSDKVNSPKVNEPDCISPIQG